MLWHQCPETELRNEEREGSRRFFPRQMSLLQKKENTYNQKEKKIDFKTNRKNRFLLFLIRDKSIN